MRNIFDQYTQPENRLTHALACALYEDAALLRAFVTWVGGVAPPDGELEIVEQSRPGVRADDDGDGSASSLPDAWITCREDERWALLIEAKVQAPVDVAQLEQHRLTAGRHGAADPTLVLITARPPGVALPENVFALRWCAVYAWFRDRRAHSAWARRFAEYVEIVEAKWIARDYLMEGNLTMFTGIESTAETGYSPQRAKQQLRHAMEAICAHPRCRDLEFDPQTAVGIQSSGAAGNVLKEQPQWLTAVYDALTNKTANLELCLGGRMTYDYPDAHTPVFIDRVLDAWEATIPLLRALHVVR